MVLSESLTALIDSMSPTVEKKYVEQVFAEFVNLERRYYFGDWGPAECDAGRFCEALVNPLNLLNRGTTTTQSPSVFATKLVNVDIDHNLNRTDRKNLSKMMLSVYEIRSSRNSVHFAPGYSADCVDSVVTVASCKWLLCELVRLVSGQSNEQTAKLLRGLAQLGDPVIFELDGRPIIMRLGLSAPQEILILLLHRPGYAATKSELIQYAAPYHSAKSIGISLPRLESKRQVALSTDGKYYMTTLGRDAALKLLE